MRPAVRLPFSRQPMVALARKQGDAMTQLPEKIQRRIVPIPESGCWIWEGTISNKGYGRMTIKRKNKQAHRLVYELLRGAIPPKLTLDHLCRVRLCVNPDHLEVVTMKENILRGFSLPAINSRKTHCLYGHPYTEGNFWVDKRGRRHCRKCKQNNNAVIL